MIDKFKNYSTKNIIGNKWLYWKGPYKPVKIVNIDSVLTVCLIKCLTDCVSHSPPVRHYYPHKQRHWGTGRLDSQANKKNEDISPYSDLHSYSP